MSNWNAPTTTLGLLSLESTKTTLYSTLQYRPSYRFYYQFDTIHIAPLSSGFSHFSLLSGALPAPLSLDPVTGTIHGGLRYPTVFNVTVSAENMVDHTQSTASFSVEVRECNGNHTVLQIEKTNQLYSSVEILNITTSEENYLSRGYDSLSGASSQSMFYCIPKEVVSLASFVRSDALMSQRSLRAVTPGTVTVRIPYPDYTDTAVPNAITDQSNVVPNATTDPIAALSRTVVLLDRVVHRGGRGAVAARLAHLHSRAHERVATGGGVGHRVRLVPPRL